jgi:hypothetical protein
MIDVLHWLVVAYLFLFWAVYVLVMGLYRAHLAGRLGWPAYVMGIPWLAVGVVMDVLANIVIASIVFFERPREWLVTTRLVRWQSDASWRGAIARWVCKNLLDVFDPSGTHCV